MNLQEKEVSAYKAEHQNMAERLMREMPPVWWPRPMMNCASFSGSQRNVPRCYPLRGGC